MRRGVCAPLSGSQISLEKSVLIPAYFKRLFRDDSAVTFPAFRLEYTRRIATIASLPGNGISASSLHSRRDLANMQFSDSQYQTSSAAP